MTGRVLYGLGYSPWTAKARWALAHHEVDYTYREYTPMLGELALRFRSRGTGAKATVPLLVTDEGPIGDSFAIARFADRIGRGAPLVPAEFEGDVTAWNDRSEATLAVGRAHVVASLANDGDALLEALPRFIPKALRRASIPVARAGVRFIGKKYGATSENEVVLEHLDALRRAIETNGRHLVDGRFTHADIAMACALQIVEPVSDRFIRMGPATRKAWRRNDLAERYPDLLAWRDALFADFRRR